MNYRDKRRIIAALLSGVMIASLTPPPISAEAAETTETLTVTRTDIKADSFMGNYEGYGSIQRDDLDRDGGVTQSALIDRNGNFIFPYKDGIYYYSVYDGVVSYCLGAYIGLINWDRELEGQGLEPAYYSLDGSRLFEDVTLPDTIHFPQIGQGETPVLAHECTPMIAGHAVVEFEGGGGQAFIDETGTVTFAVRDLDGGFGYDSDDNEVSLLNTGWFGDNGWTAYFAYGPDMLVGYLNAGGEKMLSAFDPVTTEPILEVSEAWPFQDGLSIVRDYDTDKVGAIDTEGNYVIPCEYNGLSVSKDSEGILGASKNGRYGFINRDNQVVIPFEYDLVDEWGDGLGKVALRQADTGYLSQVYKYGLIDIDNQVVLPVEYDALTNFIDGVAYGIKDGEVYIITRSGSDEPGNPDAPETPENPDTPQNPAVPENPDDPQNPSVPEKPEENKVQAITVTPEELSMKAGERKTLSYTSTPSDAEKISVTWHTTDSKVASVDQDGTVTAVKKGTAEIYCVSQGEEKVESNHCVVTVTSSGSGISGGMGGGIGGAGIGGSGGGSGSSGGSSGSSSSGGSSSGSGSSGSKGSGPAGGSASLPSYVTRGSWAQAEDGSWKFTDLSGNTYANTWAAVENQYANTAAGQQGFDWFRFDENGKMLTGWFYDQADGRWYYLNPVSDGTLGKMMTGWVIIDGAYYYFNENSDGSRGRMYVNETTPDGYQVAADGRWVQ